MPGMRSRTSRGTRARLSKKGVRSGINGQSYSSRLTVVPGRDELKVGLEGQVGLGHLEEVKRRNLARVADDGPELDRVDERFSERNLLDARVVKAVYVVPDCAPDLKGQFLFRWGFVVPNSQPIFSSLYSWSSIAAM